MKLAFYISSIICFGITNCLWVYPIKKLSVLSTIIYRTIVTSSLFLLILSLNHYQIILLKPPFISLGNFSWLATLEAFALCSINFFGLYFYLKCIKEMPVALTVGIQKVNVIFSICFGIFVYKEVVGLVEWICCAIFLFSALIIEGVTFKLGKQWFSKGFKYLILAILFWNTSVLFKPLLQQMGVIPFSLILEMAVLAMATLLLTFSKNEAMAKPDRQTWGYLVVIALFGFMGVLGINVAIEGLPISLLSIIGLIGPCTTLLISVFILKEKIIVRQWVGIALCLMSAFLLSLK